MTREVESMAISNGDTTNPIELSVVQSTDDATVYGIVGLNPDGTKIGS